MRTPFLPGILLFVIISASFAADDPEMKKSVTAMWAAEDFSGLEKTAQQCRQAKLDVLDRIPLLTRFYTALKGSGIASDQEAATKLVKFERWRSALPDSVTARVALAEFHISDAWRARGNGWASEVRPEAWPVFKERLGKAREILTSSGMEIQNDPTIADLRIILTMAGADAGLMEHYWEAVKWWPEYFPVNASVAQALLPRWGGGPGEAEFFCRAAASRFQRPKADGLYALIANRILEAEEDSFFKSADFDIPRYIRGLDVLATEGESSYRAFSKQRAAFLEAVVGNPEVARTRIFEIGPRLFPTAYLSHNRILPAWRKCGVLEELETGIALERSGKLPEAEAFYSELTQTEPNPWVESFALRNGIARLWRAEYGSPSPDFPIEKADPNQLFELTLFHLCSANLEEARKYAEAFDAKRGHNITGKYTLACIAALQDDKPGMEAIKTRFLALKTDRKNYQLAQEFVSGKSRWENLLPQMPRDDYFTQACSMMAVFALGEGRREEARRIFEEIHQQMPFQVISAFPESMLWGALARNFPNALPE